MTTIIDLAARKLWILSSRPSGCTEIALMENPAHPQPWSGSDATEELVGSETIDGHPCRKYRRTTNLRGKSHSYYLWRATDLGGFPVRSTDESGTYETLFRNVVLGKPDPKLFELPPGCASGSLAPR